MSNLISDLFNVNGLVAVITGGGSGLGLYAARALDANGAAAVYIVGRREATLKEAAATAKNGKIIPLVGDVSSKDSLKAVADQIRKEQGYINFLFCNAGVPGPRARDYLPTYAKGEKPSIEEAAKGLFEPDMDDFTKTLHVNTTAVYYTAIAFFDLLDAGNKKRNMAQDSQIVITSSVAGFSRYLAGSFAYSTSKAAVNHLAKMLSTFFAQQGYHIRVNLIAPGLYPSEMTTRSTSSLEKLDSTAFAGAHRMEPKESPSERTGR
jgi:NAD(P)-dependent dehydrogenase (short-subunit alcohol dehydrogenase family)